METVKKWLPNLVLLSIAIIIHFISINTIWIEKYYSTGIYPYISASLMYLLGWLPFSAGDVFYGVFVIWLIYSVVQTFRFYIHNSISTGGLYISALKSIKLLLVIYIFFNVFKELPDHTNWEKHIAFAKRHPGLTSDQQTKLEASFHYLTERTW